MKKRTEETGRIETLRFMGMINDDSTLPFQTLFDQACSEGKSIRIISNSAGGDPDDAFAIYDTIRRSGANVETVAEGIVASAALIVFLAGDRRAITQHAYICVHQLEATPHESLTISEIDRMRQHLKKIKEIYVDIICERTGQPRGKVLRDICRGRYFYAEDAIKYGYAHTII